mgnify:CR=1 FL=1
MFSHISNNVKLNILGEKYINLFHIGDLVSWNGNNKTKTNKKQYGIIIDVFIKEIEKPLNKNERYIACASIHSSEGTIIDLSEN